MTPAQFSNPFWKAEQNAMEVLARNKIKGADIIRTGKDAVLFSQAGKAWTAWLEDDGISIARLDSGFPAEF